MKLALFTKNRTNPAYDGARYGANLIAARHGAEVRDFAPDIPDDPEQQSQLIAEALRWKADAVLIAPVHLEKVRPAMLEIVEAGVPILGFVNRMPDIPYVSYVSSDDEALAQGLARHLFERMGGQGSVAMIEGPSHSVTSNIRVAAFLAEARRFPGIRITERVAGEYQHADARQAFARLLERVPCPDAVLAANDIMAIGVLEAIDARPQPRPEPLIAGINAIPQVIEALAAGRMVATADFSPLRMAALATESAIAHLNGERVPETIVLPVQIVDQQLALRWGTSWASRSLVSLKDFQ